MTGPRLTKRGKPYELLMAARAYPAARRRRRRDGDPLGRGALETLRGLLPLHAIADSRIVDVAADRPPWQDGGLDLQADDRVTTFAVGRVYLSKPLDVWVGPQFQLWYRVGGVGPVFRGTRATNSFEAERAGRLELASYFPGEWGDRDGGLGTDPDEYSSASGGMSVLVIRWAKGADHVRELHALAAADPTGLAGAECERLERSVPTPPGWHYLWYLGDSEIFEERSANGDRQHVGCHTDGDVGILQREVDLPLTDATRLRWSWCVDELPSALPEDTLVTHDYMSIALEFDNGQDLTWQWSASLPVEHAYRCPIPTWAAKETHVVVRSGSEELGQWLREERPVLRDYLAAVGTPAPVRIVKVWLIAVSLFQRGTGRCAFSDIEIAEGGASAA